MFLGVYLDKIHVIVDISKDVSPTTKRVLNPEMTNKCHHIWLWLPRGKNLEVLSMFTGQKTMISN